MESIISDFGCYAVGLLGCLVVMVVPFALVAGLRATVGWGRRMHRTGMRRLGLCPSCGYDRGGLPAESPCPECGGG